MRTASLLVLGTIVGALPVAGQAIPLPSYSAPYRAFATSERGLGIHFPGGTDIAFEGFYGIGRGRWDIRFRGGVALGSGTGNTDAVLVGAEFRQRVLTHDADFPADGALILGAGAWFGDGESYLQLPVAVSFGRRVDLEDSDVSIVPYVQPTLLLRAGDIADEIAFTLGLGADFRLTPAFDLRVAAGFGDVDGFSIGAVWLR